MKKTFKVFFIILFSLSMLFFGCKSEKNKLVGEWNLEWSFVNGTRDTEDTKFTWIIMDDGAFRQIIVSTYNTEELKGKWIHDSKYKTIKFLYPNGNSVSWNIIKLEDTSMDINHTTTPGFFIERRYLKQKEN